MQSDNLKSYLHLHLIVFIWGFTAVLGKLISLQAIDLVWYRMAFALGFMLLYFFFSRESLKISIYTFFSFLFSGIVIAAHWFTFYEAIKVSNISITLACLSTGAFFASILEPIIYCQKINWTNVFLGLFVVLGLYFVAFAEIIDKYGFVNSFKNIFSDSNVKITGVLLALTSALLSALFSVINGKFAKDYNPNVISFYELLGGLCFFSIYMFFTDSFSENFFSISKSDILWLFILGSVCTAYAFSASIKVMKYLSPYTVMLTINMEPIYGIILALLIFTESEQMNSLFYVGAIIIITSVVFNGILNLKKVKN
jgi:drug/metabolite transporter (DMT)-like permease